MTAREPWCDSPLTPERLAWGKREADACERDGYDKTAALIRDLITEVEAQRESHSQKERSDA